MSSQFPQCPYSTPVLLCYFLHKRINFKSAYQNTLVLANEGKCFKIFIKRSNQTQSVLLIKITKSASGFEVLQDAKFSAMGNRRKMREKLPSTKQIFLYRLVIANSVIHVREFSRKELEYVIIMHIILDIFTLVNFISNILEFLICLIFQVLLYVVSTFCIHLSVICGCNLYKIREKNIYEYIFLGLSSFTNSYCILRGIQYFI